MKKKNLNMKMVGYAFFGGIILLATILTHLGQSHPISCPILQCEDPNPEGPTKRDLCWETEKN